MKKSFLMLRKLNKKNDMKSICKIAIALIFFNLSIALADGGSNYSLFGLGDLHAGNSSMYEALGGTSIAFPSEHAINLTNPAMWSELTTSRIQLGYKFNQSAISQESSSTLFQNNGGMNQYLVSFAIDTSMGISAVFGVMSESSVNYYVSLPLSQTNGDLTITGKTLYKGSGGLSSAFLGSGFRITDDLSLGVAANVTFGKINTKVDQIYNQEYAFQSITSSKAAYEGMGLRFGANYKASENLSLGAFLYSHRPMSVNKTILYSTQFGNDTTFSSDETFDMPLEWGLGASYKLEKFIFGLDVSMQDFTEFKYNKFDNVKYKNSMSASIGVQRIGNPNRSADFLDKITYNFGFNYKQLYYNVFGSDINEMSLSTGFNIPISASSKIDAALVFGTRGQTTSALVKENFFRFNINFSIGDNWFKPFKQTYD